MEQIADDDPVWGAILSDEELVVTKKLPLYELRVIIQHARATAPARLLRRVETQPFSFEDDAAPARETK